MLCLRTLLGLGSLALVVPGCTIHPNPQDVTGYSTSAIVEQIRCEAQDAVEYIRLKAPRIYAKGSIAYDFTFTITENNNVGVDASVLFPFSSGFGKFSTVAGAGKDRQRQSERKFSMAEKFVELAQPNPPIRCPADGVRENWAYPITGRIGLKEIVKAYVDLERHSTRLDTFSDQVMFREVCTLHSPRIMAFAA